MTLADVIASTTWAEVKAALQWLFPQEVEQLPGYREIFLELRRMKSEPDPMHISIELQPLVGYDEDSVPEVVGRNGKLNRDLEDFKYSGKHATSEHGAEEVRWSISLSPRRNWLGMEIESATLRMYPLPQIVAHCLSDMTFHGFSEAENRAFSEKLRKQVAEIEAMSAEERDQKLIPAEKVVADMKAKYGFKD